MILSGLVLAIAMAILIYVTRNKRRDELQAITGATALTYEQIAPEKREPILENLARKRRAMNRTYLICLSAESALCLAGLLSAGFGAWNHWFR